MAISGSSAISSISEYFLSFKTKKTISKNNFIVFNILPSSGFLIPANPNCQTFPINGKTIQNSLTCSVISNGIIFKGFSVDFPENAEIGLKFNLQNPNFSGITGVFELMIFRDKTRYLYALAQNIPGVTITPGAFTSVSLTKENSNAKLSMKKVFDYILKFTTANVIPDKGVIRISLPGNLKLAYKTNFDLCHYVGVGDISGNDLSYHICLENEIIIKNVKSIAVNVEITVNFRAFNPPVEGEIIPLKIQSFKDETLVNVIDEDITNAKVTVENISLLYLFFK